MTGSADNHNNGGIPPVPDVPEQPPAGGDSFASKEREKIFVSDATRQNELKGAIHTAMVWTIRLAAIAMLAIFMIRMFHLGAPKCWRWLDADELQALDNLLFSGVLGALLGRNFDKIITPKRD